MHGRTETSPDERDAARRHVRQLIVLVAVLFGSWTIWSTQILPRLESGEGAQQSLRSIGIRLLLWIVPAGVYLWIRYRRKLLAGLRLNLPPSGKHWALSLFVIGAASVAVSLDVARKLGVTAPQVWSLLLERLSWEFPTAPVFEELIFRGVILAELLVLLRVPPDPSSFDLTSRQRAWLANLAATVVFVGLHWPWWIYTGGFNHTFWMNTAGVSLISLVLGMLFFRARSLWPCIVLHWLNNELSALAG